MWLDISRSFLNQVRLPKISGEETHEEGVTVGKRRGDGGREKPRANTEHKGRQTNGELGEECPQRITRTSDES